MSRAYKCDICGGFFESDTPKTYEVVTEHPTQSYKKIVAQTNFRSYNRNADTAKGIGKTLELCGKCKEKHS